jgi:hypothetical protein
MITRWLPDRRLQTLFAVVCRAQAISGGFERVSDYSVAQPVVVDCQELGRFGHKRLVRRGIPAPICLISPRLTRLALVCLACSVPACLATSQGVTLDATTVQGPVFDWMVDSGVRFQDFLPCGLTLITR